MENNATVLADGGGDAMLVANGGNGELSDSGVEEMREKIRPVTLPQEVVTTLESARFLHLATNGGIWPHVSLMNFTFLHINPHPHTVARFPDDPTAIGPVVVLTVQASTRKTVNLLSNPRVSLLVHDWIAHRDALTRAAEAQSSLASLLTHLNLAAISSISATLYGHAHLIPAGTDEEDSYKQLHAANCRGTGESQCYLEGPDARIAVVTISWARVADYKGGIRDWIAPGQGAAYDEFQDENQGNTAVEEGR